MFVTGAGFTRAFVPDAPLLVDDFDNDGLVDRVRGLPNASRLLEWERNQHPDGFINISKSGLLTEPVLRLVWTLAFETLTTAKKVTFIGYSFPSTDLAARTLFSEALRDLPRENIRVVDLATEEADIVRFQSRYRGVLGEIPDDRFSFDGAGPWIRTLVDAMTDRHGSPSNPI